MNFTKKHINLGRTRPVKMRLRAHGLHTVCEEAACPNISECFARGTATFMILGDVCTRRCGFCGVKSVLEGGRLLPPDASEPERIARMAAELKLKHVVVTSVTRDDLDDEGAGHFAEVINRLKQQNRQDPLTVEVLTPDFHGRRELLDKVCSAGPDVFNHNIETVRRLTPAVRSGADYERSMGVLEFISKNHPRMVLKSGLMLGLGERHEEVVETLRDLCKAGCRMVTIGQYLAPNNRRLKVVEHIDEARFEEYKVIGEKFGITHVFSGPFVRSSYMADKNGGCHGSQSGA